VAEPTQLHRYNNIAHPRFHICICLQPNHEHTTKVEQKSSSTNRILLVDDEPDVIFTFKKGLEANGFVVDAFEDPVLALSNFKPGIYGLLLLDVKMPQINGFELYEKIKKIDSEVKACFITAHEVYYESLRELFPSMDLDCYVKPIQIEDLVRHVNRHMKRSVHL
jgi:two-component system, OmpR family, response regulator ChvI